MHKFAWLCVFHSTILELDSVTVPLNCSFCQLLVHVPAVLIILTFRLDPASLCTARPPMPSAVKHTRVGMIQESGMAAPLLCSPLQLSLEHPFLNVPQVCSGCSLCPGPFRRLPSQLKMSSPPPWTNPTPNFCSPSATLCAAASAPPKGKSLPCGPGFHSSL